jgi:hypothetical protein
MFSREKNSESSKHLCAPLSYRQINFGLSPRLKLYLAVTKNFTLEKFSPTVHTLFSNEFLFYFYSTEKTKH